MNHDRKVTRLKLMQDVRHRQGSGFVVGGTDFTRTIDGGVTQALDQIVGLLGQVLGEVGSGGVDEDDLQLREARVFQRVITRTVELFADVDGGATSGINYDFSHIKVFL